MSHSTLTAPLPTSVRVVSILHLCFVLSYLCWSAAAPFLLEHLSFKQQLGLYKTLQGHEDLVQGLPAEEAAPLLQKLRAHQERFAALPPEHKEPFIQGYQSLLQRPQRAWAESSRQVLRQLTLGIPPFLQAYLLLSLGVVFLTLFRIEGTASASWVLLLLLLVYTVNNRLDGKASEPSAFSQSYPSEEELVARYYPDGLAEAIDGQYQQLKAAWENYLIDEWTQGTDAALASRQQSIEEGEFFFSLAQLESMRAHPALSSTGRARQIKGSFALQCLAIAWTLFYSLFLNQHQAFRRVRS
jgi:hypothetical protein